MSQIQHFHDFIFKDRPLAEEATKCKEGHFAKLKWFPIVKDYNPMENP